MELAKSALREKFVTWSRDISRSQIHTAGGTKRNDGSGNKSASEITSSVTKNKIIAGNYNISLSEPP